MTSSFKHDIRNLVSFHPTTVFPQSVKAWDKKIRKSYLWWHWSVMQKLNKLYDLVVSKRLWGIGWTLIKAMGLVCPKHNVSARRFQRDYVSWNWEVMQNLSKNWHVTWKMTRSLVNIHASSWETENLHLMVSFCQKHIML